MTRTQPTKRELETLRLVAQGLPNKTIATELGISIKTVEKHRNKLNHLANVSGVVDLLRQAFRLKWLDAQEWVGELTNERI